ncbi:hypothetical protein ACQUY5_18265 [Bacillus cereus]|uniref:hypothetical protein n=1 Tax=Bacillus cereus TaxID=1396 RepID=UPI003D16A2FE
MEDVDANVEIVMNVVARKNRNVSVKNVIVNMKVGKNDKKKEYFKVLFLFM